MRTLKADLFPVIAEARAVDLRTSQVSIDCLQSSVMCRVIVVKRTFNRQKTYKTFIRRLSAIFVSQR